MNAGARQSFVRPVELMCAVLPAKFTTVASVNAFVGTIQHRTQFLLSFGGARNCSVKSKKIARKKEKREGGTGNGSTTSAPMESLKKTRKKA